MVLPQAMRLKGHKCFDHIHKAGTRYHGSLMLVRVAKANPNLLKASYRNLQPESFKCAIAISNKVSKKAVIRNRLRRVLHNHLKEKIHSSSKNLNKWTLISLKPNASDIEDAPLLQECDKLLHKAGLLV